MSIHRTHIARVDEASVFRVSRRTPLLFEGGAVEAEDLPAHIRGASALLPFEAGFAVVQDDVNALGILSSIDAAFATALLLPRGDDGSRQFDDVRGNKRLRFDFESGIALDRAGVETLLLFGSGSSSARETVAFVSRDEARQPRVTLRAAPHLYAALRRDVGFAGAELNLEGAVHVGEEVWFFQRGNGKPSTTEAAVDAITRLPLERLLGHLEAGAPIGETRATCRYDLGAIEESARGTAFVGTGDPPRGRRTRLTFTDATSLGSEVWFLAAAEASPDAISDGPVAGACVGWLDAEGAPWLVSLVDADGEPVREKVEGLAMIDDGTMLLVVDHDSPSKPAELWIARREASSHERLSR